MIQWFPEREHLMILIRTYCFHILPAGCTKLDGSPDEMMEWYNDERIIEDRVLNYIHGKKEFDSPWWARFRFNLWI
jgi:hypothetical protein